MPQWRKLHTKSLESMDINDMPDDFTRLLWIMMVLILDREGRGIDNPAWIKAKAMPLRTDVTLEMVQKAVDWYADRGMICRYDLDGRNYFLVPSWHDHQSTSKEAPSIYPDPLDYRSNSGVSLELVQSKLNQSGNSHKKISLDTSLSLSESISRIFTIYEKEIGVISKMISEEIEDYLDRIPEGLQEDWFTRAIKEAVKSNARNWRYVKAILDRWIEAGHITTKKENQIADDPELAKLRRQAEQAQEAWK